MAFCYEAIYDEFVEKATNACKGSREVARPSMDSYVFCFCINPDEEEKFPIPVIRPVCDQSQNVVPSAMFEVSSAP